MHAHYPVKREVLLAYLQLKGCVIDAPYGSRFIKIKRSKRSNAATAIITSNDFYDSKYVVLICKLLRINFEMVDEQLKLVQQF